MRRAGGTQVALSWSASNGATNYNVKSSTTNGGPYTTIGSTAATSYTNTGLANGTTYYYVVSAVNSYGESTNSAQISATTTVPSANLALNKPVTASSDESAAYPGTNAVDGNYTTRWSSAFSDPQWIYVDLQAYVNVNRVKLDLGSCLRDEFSNPGFPRCHELDLDLQHDHGNRRHQGSDRVIGNGPLREDVWDGA